MKFKFKFEEESDIRIASINDMYFKTLLELKVQYDKNIVSAKMLTLRARKKN